MALRYLLFALFSTGVNLAFQWLSFYLYGGSGALYVAMFVGTLSGLVVKYLLDSRWIFDHKPSSHQENAKSFALYTLMGGFTTVIFWGVEMLFDHLFDKKYLGAILGLFVGYILKYFLDKKFVFKEHK